MFRLARLDMHRIFSVDTRHQLLHYCFDWVDDFLGCVCRVFHMITSEPVFTNRKNRKNDNMQPL